MFLNQPPQLTLKHSFVGSELTNNMRVELVSSQHWRRRGSHQGPDSNHHEHQKQHPLHRKTPKKPPLSGGADFRVLMVRTVDGC